MITVAKPAKGGKHVRCALIRNFNSSKFQDQLKMNQNKQDAFANLEIEMMSDLYMRLEP